MGDQPGVYFVLTEKSGAVDSGDSSGCALDFVGDRFQRTYCNRFGF